MARPWLVALLVALLGGGLILGGCSSTTTIIQAVSVTSMPTPSPGATSSAASQGCFDRNKIIQLSNEWKKTAMKLAKMRTTNREIALELALATAADPAVAGHFKDAADAYGKAPPNNANPTTAEFSKTMDAMAAGATAMAAGADSLTRSSVPFC